jgi:hypothetical protein
MNEPTMDVGQTDGVDTVPCPQCGVEGKPGGHCSKCGGFMPANKAAETHGLSRWQGGKSTPLDIQARDEHVKNLLADKGGATECSAVLQPQLVDLAQAIQLRDAAWSFIAVVGPWTRAGRQRPATGLYLAASARAQALAAQVGLGRAPAKVPSLQEYLSARLAQQAEQPQANEHDAGTSDVAVDDSTAPRAADSDDDQRDDL